MRFIHGAVAFFIWTMLLAWFSNNGYTFSDELAILTLSIAAAGAMAGGD